MAYVVANVRRFDPIANVKRFGVLLATLLTVAALIAVAAPKSPAGSIAAKGLGVFTQGLRVVGLLVDASGQETNSTPGIAPPLAVTSIPFLAVGDSADLIADVLVQVPVDVTCVAQPGDFTSLNVTVAQNVDGSLAFGSGGTSLTCDGQLNSYVVNVLSIPGSSPFQEGAAAVLVRASVCPRFSPCETEEVGQGIELVTAP